MILSKLAKKILDLPRYAKRLIALLLDICLCILAVWIAYYLRLGYWVRVEEIPIAPLLISISFAVPIFIFFGLYRAIFRYSGWPALMTVSKAAIIYAITYITVFTAIGVNEVPRTIGIIQPVILFFFVGALRAFARIFLGGSHLNAKDSFSTQSRVLIYGAGISGRQLAAALRNTPNVRVLGYLDDDINLQGGVLNGLTIHKPEDLESLVNSLLLTDVFLAIPSASRARRNEILNGIAKQKIKVRTLPSLSDLVDGKITASDLRELDVEDLLGRNPINPRVDLLRKNLFNSVVMVTGAGGSIGSELCRQIINQSPKKLILFEQNEYALYAVHQQLQNKIVAFRDGGATSQVELVSILGSVLDSSTVSRALEAHHPKTIFHAAAYKHVPLVEENYVQGIKNNIFGTKTLAFEAIKHGVANFVLVSTDKAVRPTNVMGATKRVSEMVLQALANSDIKGQTIFSMVRFGNVLDSSGSVVPLFRKQIADGGPITLTHPDVTRYFMTIPEAASLVVQAGAMASGGEVFVLDMGDPVRIIELARHMIDLSGQEERSIEKPDGDIEIQITGLRPGEKLFEELLIGDNPIPTEHKLIMKAQEEFLALDELEINLSHLDEVIDRTNAKEAKVLLKNLVPGYTPSNA
jgi:nucleoside-diphosphate-sugar epimerase